MIHHDTNHFQTYLIFFFISIILIGTLALLFMPPPRLREIQSSALDNPAHVDKKGAAFLDSPLPTDTQSAAFLDSPLPTDTPPEIPEDALVAKRIKFTKMLLQYQGDLQGLEAQKTGIDSVNPDLEEEIKTLTIKIQNLQNIISSLAQ